MAVGGLAVALLGLTGSTAVEMVLSTAQDVVSTAQPRLSRPAHADRAAVAANYGKLPLRFEANVGQFDPEAKFVARAKGVTAFLTDGEAVLSVGSTAVGPAAGALGEAVVRMRPLDTNPAVRPEGVDVLPGVSNYLRGSNPAGWHTGATSYAAVRYPGVYPGIDQVFHGRNSALEYDFVVAPGADPSQIALGFDGATSRELDAATGELVVHTDAGEVRQAKPVLYQEVEGARRHVAGAFVISGDRIGFSVGAYDASLPLVIDPIISYAALFGGSGTEEVAGIDVDSSGAAYVGGSTTSANFPTVNAYQGTLVGARDMFITKLTPDGTALVYSTYIGGPSSERATGVAVDPTGAAYIFGTGGAGFPMAGNSFDTTARQLVMAKLSSDGSTLAYSTFLGGGTSGHTAGGISVDSQGNAYVTGSTTSAAFPTTDGAVPGTQAAYDRFCGTNVTDGLPDGTCNRNATFTDGSTTAGSPIYTALPHQPGGEAVGLTITGANIPPGTTVLAASDDGTQLTLSSAATGTGSGLTFTIIGLNSSGRADAFVAKINTLADTGLSSLAYSTYLGGGGTDAGTAVAAAPNESFGGVYVTGSTSGLGFPSTPTAFQTACDRQATPAAPCALGTNAFVVKLNTGLGGADSLLGVDGFATYLGSRGNTVGQAITADGSGVYVTGRTNAPGFPTKNAVQPLIGANDNTNDAFVTRLVLDGTNVVYSTFLGGSAADAGTGIAVDETGAAYVSGSTSSSNFPTKNSILGSAPGFLSKLIPTGSALDYSTYLTLRGSVATNPAGGGAAYAAGAIQASDFPGLPGALRAGPGGGPDAAVLKIISGDTPTISKLVPRGGPLSGGTPVVITGDKFTGATAVTFGGTPALSFTVDSPTQITAISPAHADGTIEQLTVGVVVTTPQAATLSSPAARYVYGEGVFHPTGDCAAGRCPNGGQAVTLVDGRVLYTNGASDSFPASSQLYNPATGAWTTTGACGGCGFGLGGHAFTTTVLQDGKVLVAGGPVGSNPTAGAFLYNPTTGTWSATGSMTQPRSGHTATLLSDGRVLVAGGCTTGPVTCIDGIAPIATAELYTPATGQWATTGNMTIARQEHTATLLDASTGPCGAVCGRVLVAFGTNAAENADDSAELFDPATGTWRATGSSLGAGRTKHSAVRLLDGRVLAAAGRDNGSFGSNLQTAEVYSPATETWAPTGNLLFARASRPPMVRLPSGKVLLLGVLNDIAEIWDPADGEWRSATSTVGPVRIAPAAAVLLSGPASACGTNCGKVLLAGGFLGDFSAPLASAELYTPQPSISTVSPTTAAAGTTVTITGTGLTTVSTVRFGSVAATSITHDAANPDGMLTAVVPLGLTGTVDVTATSLGGVSAVTPATQFSTKASFSTFVAVSPARILDTRSGNGAPAAPVGAGQSIDVQVTGQGGVPVTGVTAVAMNVTAVAPTAGTFITAWPTGETRPTASNVNLNAGAIVPNLTLVKVGAGGRVSLFNSAGLVHLLADVAGYYLDPSAAVPGASFAAVSPSRILDTRTGVGAPLARVAAGQSIELQVTGQGGVPATGVAAVAVNVTAVNPSTTSFVTAWPTGETRPTASNLNLAAGVTRPNMVIVKVGAGGKISLYNDSGTVDLLGDVAGYYLNPGAVTPASTFTALSPARILDTRFGVGAPTARVGAGQSIEVQITGQGGVPATGVSSVVMNVTAVAPSATSFVTAWPSGENRPLASNLNVVPGVTVANLVIVKVGSGGKVSLYNDTGTTDLIADVAGYNAT